MSGPSPTMTIMLRAAEKAARSLNRDFGEVENLQVSRKGPADFVSAADKRAEEILFTELKKARPSFGFLMEESGEVKGEDGEHRFIIDPLDGTTNFLHGIPQWSISIGLEKAGQIIAGLVFNPISNETFLAEKGTGAWMQNRRLRVSSRSDMGSSVIGGGDAVTRSAEIKKDYIATLSSVITQTAGFRRMGSAALDLCYVAAGRFDGFWEMGLKPWDCAAGVLIVREAGGTISSLKGNADPIYADTILASNALLHQPLKTLLTSAGA
jgi:myo-inositol-1(or 4)-monophosphatase